MTRTGERGREALDRSLGADISAGGHGRLGPGNESSAERPALGGPEV
jgi:hypothetical protein